MASLLPSSSASKVSSERAKELLSEVIPRCPHCGQEEKRLGQHLESKHDREAAGEDYARYSRNICPLFTCGDSRQVKEWSQLLLGGGMFLYAP